MHRVSLGLVIALAACRGGSSPGAPDAMLVADAATDDARDRDASDSLDGAAAFLDSAVEPDAAGCGELAEAPANVFVDAASRAESVGTAACPFHTIAEATALTPPLAGAARAIHVAGGTPATVYTEAVLIRIAPGVTLAGEDAARVTIIGGGPCTLAVGNCTVSLAGGGTLRAITVTNTTDFAVEIGGDGTALVDRVVATGAPKHGFLVRGNATFDHAVATSNQQDGVNAKAAMVTVVESELFANKGDGLDLDQGAVLDLTGGRVDNNQGVGIRLHNGSSFTVLSHRVTGALIRQNLLSGIDVASNATLALRGTTLFQNEMGVQFQVGPGNQLDLGTAADPGDNVIAGATAVNANVRAGVCFQQSGGSPSQVVEGNSWRTCPPSVRKVAGPFCVSNNTYADLAYVPAVATSGSPFVAPAECTTGP